MSQTNTNEEIGEISFKKIGFLDQIEIPDLTENDFRQIHVSPLFNIGHGSMDVGQVGEANKVVPVSKDRIVGIEITQEAFTVKVTVSVKSLCGDGSIAKPWTSLVEGDEQRD